VYWGSVVEGPSAQGDAKVAYRHLEEEEEEEEEGEEEEGDRALAKVHRSIT
jgi:hypothetical protein